MNKSFKNKKALEIFANHVLHSKLQLSACLDTVSLYAALNHDDACLVLKVQLLVFSPRNPHTDKLEVLLSPGLHGSRTLVCHIGVSLHSSAFLASGNAALPHGLVILPKTAVMSKN